MFRNPQRIATLAALVLAAGAVLAAPEPPAPAAATGKPVSPAFERFKALAGDWVAAEDGEIMPTVPTCC